jgi:hypothetical protein
VRNREDYFLRPPKPKHFGRKIKGEEWFFSENDNDNRDTNPTFEFWNKIQTFNYKKLVKVIAFEGTTRIVEGEDSEDSYTDSLEEGDSKRYLECAYSDEDGENENRIVENEIDWYKKRDKFYKLDENKKKFYFKWEIELQMY